MPVALGEAASAGVATASSVLTAAMGAIAKQTGVHLAVTSQSSSSSGTEKVVADLGAKFGVETISEAKETVTIKLTPTYGYVTGNPSGLTNLLGLSSAEVKRIGKDWVSVKAGTSQYSGLQSGLTVSSLVSVLPKAKGTKLSTETTKAADLYVLKWTTVATSSSPELSSTLTLSAVGAALPVGETTTAPGGGKETATFSKWGEAVRAERAAGRLDHRLFQGHGLTGRPVLAPGSL